MEHLASEREARAAFLTSLARSQHALARILESIADVGDSSQNTAKLLRDNVSTLTNLQESIAEAVTSFVWHKRIKRKGSPVKPWLQAGVSLDVTQSLRGEAVDENEEKSGVKPKREGTRYNKTGHYTKSDK